MEDDFDENELFSPSATHKPAPIVQAVTPAQVFPDADAGNPLKGFFRQPGLSVKLPTGGRFLPKGALTLNAKGEVEVFPMRGSDELLLKSPDALMSGLAIERMIGSCVPDLKTPGLISAPDLDVLLLAIRAATYGNKMAMEITCPECGTENAFDCDLPSILATLVEIPEVLELRINPMMVINFQPHTLQAQTRLLIDAYEQSRNAQMLDQNGESLSEDEKQEVMRQTLVNVEHFQNVSLANAIVSISVPDNVVRNKAFIIEYLANASNTDTTAIRTKIEEINTMGIDRRIPAKCSNKKCKHEWTAMLEFNPATFFEQSSSA